MEPREVEITQMRSQTKEMDFELENYCKENNSLNLMVKELRLKYHATFKEIGRLTDSFNSEKSFNSRLVHDLESTSTEDYGNLKTTLLPLFERYLRNDCKKANVSHNFKSEEKNWEQENIKLQINRLEKNIQNLSDASKRKKKLLRVDRCRLKRENTILVKVISM